MNEKYEGARKELMEIVKEFVDGHGHLIETEERKYLDKLNTIQRNLDSVMTQELLLKYSLAISRIFEGINHDLSNRAWVLQESDRRRKIDSINQYSDVSPVLYYAIRYSKSLSDELNPAKLDVLGEENMPSSTQSESNSRGKPNLFLLEALQ